MFSYDLVEGHRWLVGEDALLAGCAHHREADIIPEIEATRLLMNRCAGLLFASERLERGTFTAADRDFVARNIAKAQLGAGDAVLTSLRRYHWSVRERHRQLQRLDAVERSPWMNTLARHHEAGVDFKLHPVRSQAARKDLTVQHREVSALCRTVWLWVEGRRLGAAFPTVADYVAARQPKHAGANALRNVLVNVKVFGPAAALRSGATRHPRDRVLSALPVLLWQRDELESAAQLPRLQADLATTATHFPGLVQAFHRIWSQVN
jgi:hypothetical protein